MATKTYHKAQQMQTNPDALNAARTNFGEVPDVVAHLRIICEKYADQ